MMYECSYLVQIPFPVIEIGYCKAQARRWQYLPQTKIQTIVFKTSYVQ